MATKIKGRVTRVMPNNNNFFIKPDEEHELPLRHIDVDGHRAGVDELSATNLNSARPKFRRWEGELPKVGDNVELELVRDPD